MLWTGGRRGWWIWSRIHQPDCHCPQELHLYWPRWNAQSWRRIDQILFGPNYAFHLENLGNRQKWIRQVRCLICCMSDNFHVWEHAGKDRCSSPPVAFLRLWRNKVPEPEEEEAKSLLVHPPTVCIDIIHLQPSCDIPIPRVKLVPACGSERVVWFHEHILERLWNQKDNTGSMRHHKNSYSQPSTSCQWQAAWDHGAGEMPCQ